MDSSNDMERLRRVVTTAKIYIKWYAYLNYYYYEYLHLHKVF